MFPPRSHLTSRVCNGTPQRLQVWRSIQDWDPQSRGMLATYLHAAKAVVEAKQARPGVAVHVRLGGKKRNSGVGKDDSTDIASSYAVWALSSGREVRGLMRVGCSEIAKTDIPRSAIQRVQVRQHCTIPASPSIYGLPGLQMPPQYLSLTLTPVPVLLYRAFPAAKLFSRKPLSVQQ